MILFFKNVLRFSAAWFMAALLNAAMLTCFFLYWPGRQEVTGFTGFFFYSMAAGFIPQVMLGLITLSKESFGKTGIPLFRFVLRAAIITWSVWMLLLIKVFAFFYESCDLAFFIIQLCAAVTALFFLRPSIIKS